MNAMVRNIVNLLCTRIREYCLGSLPFFLLAVQPGVSWAQQIETTAACDEGVINEPVGLVYGNSTVGCAIDPATDSDRFFFNGSSGELIRINVLTTTNAWNPTLEVRDDTNMVVDGSSCTPVNSISRCSFTLDIVLPKSGDFIMILADSGANQVGSYILQLERILPAQSVVQLNYDEAETDDIGPATDIDFYDFDATAGTSLRLNVLTTTNAWNSRVEVRDPTGAIVLNGIADGAGCDPVNSISRCSFSVDFVPALSGNYSVILYDAGTNQPGGYQISLWCIFGACDGAPTPDPEGPVINYVTAAIDSIGPAVDGDFFTFNATADTSLRLNVLTTTNAWNPRIEMRDPTGALVLDGITDGAGCNPVNSISRCSFSVDLVPASSGTYSVLIYDSGTNQIGDYQVSLWCILGDCDSDDDSSADNDRQSISYGVTINQNSVSPGVDGDFYLFQGTSGDEIQFNLVTTTIAWNPRVEVLDPSGNRVLNGLADGMGCNPVNSISTCSFTVNYLPPVTGVYSLALYDSGTNQTGGYNFTLECIFGTGPGFSCNDLPPPPPLCADNCSIAANPGQRDTDGDGFGNACDADVTNDGVVDFGDLPIFQAAFFCQTGDACYNPDADLTGDGVVDFAELPLIQQSFFEAPGPSCIDPNTP